MTKLIHREGDIFTTTARGIGHGVNLRGVMGAGIAKQFRTKFPGMYREYKALCAANDLPIGDVYTYTVRMKDGSEAYIYNIASQGDPGPEARMDWLTLGVGAALEHAGQQGLDRIALPRIGSGIGGLIEERVEARLKTLAEFFPVDIELWTYKP